MSFSDFSNLFPALGASTLAATAILFLRLAFGEKITAGTRHVLCLISAAVLLSTFTVSSPLSLWGLKKESIVENTLLVGPAPQGATISGNAEKAPIHAESTALFTWKQAVLALWLAGGLLIGGARLVNSIRVCRALEEKGEDKTAGTEDFRVAESLRSPLVIGLFAQQIWLPSSFAKNPTARRHSLAHERAHILRGDLFAQLFFDVLTTLYWFHPLAWILRGLASKDREQAADELALRELGDQEKKAMRKLCSKR